MNWLKPKPPLAVPWVALSTLRQIWQDNGYPRTILISPSAYNEIWNRLDPAGRAAESFSTIPLGFTKLKVKFPKKGRTKVLDISNDADVRAGKFTTNKGEN